VTSWRCSEPVELAPAMYEMIEVELQEVELELERLPRGFPHPIGLSHHGHGRFLERNAYCSGF
jgi:hypothetical protein